MGSMDILIVGGLAIAVGALIMYPDLLTSITTNPATGEPWFGPPADGGQFLGGDGTVQPSGGDFIVEDTPNPTGECKSKYNGKCRGECASDKFSPDCQDCIALCGGGKGCSAGQVYSVGWDKCVDPGTTGGNSCNIVGNTYRCTCSNLRSNKVRDNKPRTLPPGVKCPGCVNYCHTGVWPKAINAPLPPVRAGEKLVTPAYCKSRNMVMYGGKCMARNSPCKVGTADGYLGQQSGNTGYGVCITHKSVPKPKPAQPPKEVRYTYKTNCKCGSGSARSVIGTCDDCRGACRRLCGNCSPQCLGTTRKASVGYLYEEEPPYFYDEPVVDPETYFSNMVVSV